MNSVNSGSEQIGMTFTTTDNTTIDFENGTSWWTTIGTYYCSTCMRYVSTGENHICWIYFSPPVWYPLTPQFKQETVPHLCPKCEGEKKVPCKDSKGKILKGEDRDCPVCFGTGLVWGLKT